MGGCAGIGGVLRPAEDIRCKKRGEVQESGRSGGRQGKRSEIELGR